jgi:hypothetical protein
VPPNLAHPAGRGSLSLPPIWTPIHPCSRLGAIHSFNLTTARAPSPPKDASFFLFPSLSRRREDAALTSAFRARARARVDYLFLIPSPTPSTPLPGSHPILLSRPLCAALARLAATSIKSPGDISPTLDPRAWVSDWRPHLWVYTVSVLYFSSRALFAIVRSAGLALLLHSGASLRSCVPQPLVVVRQYDLDPRNS